MLVQSREETHGQRARTWPSKAHSRTPAHRNSGGRRVGDRGKRISFVDYKINGPLLMDGI